MATQAALEFGHHLRIMRRRVTVCAGRNLAVLGVADRTVDRAVLTGGAGPGAEDVAVTGGTGSGIRICREIGLQRFMDGMACQTGRLRLSFVMGRVTLIAVRNTAVTLTMAGLAGLLGMGAGEFLQLLGRPLVTVGTTLIQALHAEDRAGSVGIQVAIQTVCLGLPVRRVVALGTTRHDFGKVVPTWIIGVEDLMAIAAIETMRTALIAQIVELIRMAAAALSDCHWLWLGGVEILWRIIRSGSLGCGASGLGTGKGGKSKNANETDDQTADRKTGYQGMPPIQNLTLEQKHFLPVQDELFRGRKPFRTTGGTSGLIFVTPADVTLIRLSRQCRT